VGLLERSKLPEDRLKSTIDCETRMRFIQLVESSSSKEIPTPGGGGNKNYVKQSPGFFPSFNGILFSPPRPGDKRFYPKGVRLLNPDFNG